MLKRLFVGLFVGVAIGALVAAGVVEGLHLAVFGSIVAYALAGATGILVGLVAGKPIWSKGAQIEAGLKALFGALLAIGAMFAVRRWLTMDVDLTVLDPRMHDALGNLPAVSLPLIAGVLGMFFELDNTDKPDAASGERARVDASVSKKRIATGSGPREIAHDDTEVDEPVPPAKRAKR